MSYVYVYVWVGRDFREPLNKGNFEGKSFGNFEGKWFDGSLFVLYNRQ